MANKSSRELRDVILVDDTIIGELLQQTTTSEQNIDMATDLTEMLEIPEFTIGQRKPPPLFPEFQDDPETPLLEQCYKIDVIWSLLDTLPGSSEKAIPVGSRTAFKKEVTSKEVRKFLLEYLPVIPEPPEYHVCKNFLDRLLDLMKDLEVEHIFPHSDEQVLPDILWKFPEVYKDIVILMGGFHQLRVRQHILYKRYGCMGYKSWWIDAGVIASGSPEKAAEGNHHHMSMRLHKETFNALIQFRAENLTSNCTMMNVELLSQLQSLQRQPNSENLKVIIDSNSFTQLFEQIITTCEGTESRMTIAYLRDVSSLLALVSAVREADFEQHLQAERDTIKQCFAFDHVN